MNYIQAIKNFEPINEQEQNDKKLILNFIEKNNDVLYRENEYAHMTSSGLIFNKNLDKILMVHHNIYNTWSWTGGHADGDSDLLHVALKEANEETSLKNLKVLNDGIFGMQIVTVDSHIKREKFVSSHVHLDCCFLLEADENEELKIKEDENSGVCWVDINEAENLTKVLHKLNI